MAQMADAKTVRNAETEIAKAKKAAAGNEGGAEEGEVDLAESVAGGRLSLRQVPADLSKEKIALMAEQIRLIEQWGEGGIAGQKKRLHAEQFAAALHSNSPALYWL